MGTNKKDLANKRRGDYVDMLARVYNLYYYQIELIDKMVQSKYTYQEQINKFSPSNIKRMELLLTTGQLIMPRQCGK